MSPKKKEILIPVFLIGAGGVLMLVDHIRTCKENAAREKRMAETAEVFVAINQVLDTIVADLDRDVENARFWDIVTRK